MSTQSPVTLVAVLIIGTALVVAVPPMARAVAYGDARIAIALLGRARTEELVQRVEHLAQARTGTVDAADAERRRIERDLHDGTQQRLTSLAMHLGVARATLPTCPRPPRQRWIRPMPRPRRPSSSCAGSSEDCTRPCWTTGGWTPR